jgi:hypothetical protein
MSLEPDIVVSSFDGSGIGLVAELKRRGTRDLDVFEAQLKDFMVRTRCAVGLLITPAELLILRDQFRSYSPDSVERVGTFPFPTSVLGGHVEPDSGVDTEFEILVQNWLNDIRHRPEALAELPNDLKKALEDHVVPILVSGDIRAAHHRRFASRASDA